MTRRRLLKLLGAAGLAGGLGTVLTVRRANAYYAGPVTDHFDGTLFFNPDGTGPRSAWELLRWQFWEQRARWPDSFPSPHAADRPPQRVARDEVRICHVGHASFLIQAAGRNLLLDPVWSKRASPLKAVGPKRVNPPGIDFENLPPIDYVLVTHNHYDHMDTGMIGRIWQRNRAPVVTPLGNDTIVRGDVPEIDARAFDWHAVVDLGDGLRVHLEPTVHWSARGLGDRRHALWASFVIETPKHKIYCVGDSAFADGKVFATVGKRHPVIDMALLPIGAYEPRWFMHTSHMNPEESMKALELCGAKAALGHHWGTFQLTNEAVEMPREALAAARLARNIPEERFVAARPGQVVTLA
ncbi:MAG: MBL fold metallo-hydrolase [Hyphomicrobiaceae bacterium]|nr:MBL fold metallo-hydrolase [Hyphomicrobiaceae bacterium]